MRRLSSPLHRSRYPWLIGAIAVAVITLIAAIGLALTAKPVVVHPVITLGPRTAGYLASAVDLQARADLAAAGTEPYAAAVDDLLADADAARTRDPRPQEPLEIAGTDGPFVDDSAAAYGLALAYALTGDDAYAEAAARYIDAWVSTMRTTVGTCPDNGRCQTSLIIGRTASAFVFAADLIDDHQAFDASARADFVGWLRDVILPTASTLENNWGDTGAFLRITITDYLGDEVGLRAGIEQWYTQQDRVAADGHLPEETRRGTAGISYTQEALQYRVGAAVIAERRGVDLWSYRGAGGATLRDAIDYLAGYWSHPADWPWDGGAETPSTGPFWEIAYQRFEDPRYVPIIRERRPYGAQGHSAMRWTTLTNGVPLPDAPGA
ncbi:MAG: alginate lyase family protein [Candidatus Limnocylindrales bacterium]